MGPAGFDCRCRASSCCGSRYRLQEKPTLDAKARRSPGCRARLHTTRRGGGLAGVSPPDWPDGRVGFTQAPREHWCLGAIQHLAGIGGAECIIAINEDPDAPIFGAAQYKVVGDAVEVVEELLAQLER